LAGLIVIDFIDMDESKNNRTVEKVLKDALAKDRARIQMGRISGFGLMEISRQRRRLGVIEGATEVCPHCQGAGRIRSAESAALMTLRGVDIEAGRNGAGSVTLRVCTAVALYILNHKREYLQSLQTQRGLAVIIQIDDSLAQGEHAIERTETNEDFTPPEGAEVFVDLDDGFDDSAYEDEDEEDEFIDDIVEEDEDGLAREDSDDDEPRERAERAEGDRGRGRGRRRRGGRREEGDAPALDAVAAPTAEDDDDSEAGRRRRRGRRGGRRVREEGGERDAFFWVRGRTPSLDDPYVWFDPINPERAQPRAETTETRTGDVEEIVGERPEGETGGESGERNGRSRRRRGRGRGRDRGAEGGLTHEVKVETRATSEGMPPDGSPDTPMAAIVEDEPAPVAVEEPKRRRVRRKVSASATAESEAEAVTAPIEPNEAEPVVLDVTPAEAAEPEPAPAPEPETAAPVEPETPSAPEVDVAALIAEDPNQIVAPPEKPKRGWWRR
ncbi:MAG: ribonuclease E/G, partial [Alphaproteobacteria bacterium]|nr:ribonuclease E/G [Alphaproteobacteria bacterium]